MCNRNDGKEGVTPDMGSFHAQCRETKSVFDIILYTSYIRYNDRAAPKFGKHTLLFSYHKEQNT